MQTRLKHIRKNFGINQEEAAAALNVSIGTYRNWEQGRVVMNGEQLISAAALFGVSVDEILMTDVFTNKSVDEEALPLLAMFALLNDAGKAKLIDYADDLLQSGKYQKKEVQDYPIQQAASA